MSVYPCCVCLLYVFEAKDNEVIKGGTESIKGGEGGRRKSGERIESKNGKSIQVESKVK